MIAILKHGTTKEQTGHLIAWLRNMNLDVHLSEGQEFTILGLIGDTSRVDMELLSSLEIVESVKRVSEPFKQANRKFHPNDTVIEIGDVKIGGGKLNIKAGTDGVKFHLLHVLRGTDLAADYEAGKFRCLTLEEYTQWLKLCLAEVPSSVVVHRLTGDGAKRDLIAPLWSGDKKKVLNYLHQHLYSREGQ